jgi:hypothetical protein
MRKIFVILSALLLSSCASEVHKVVDLKVNYVSTNKVPVTDIDKVAQKSLLRTADSVDAEMNRLAALKLSDQSFVIDKKVDNIPNMGRKFTITWNGPMLPVIKQIAYYSKYNIEVLGKQPSSPTMIELNMKHESLQDILRNIRYQVSNSAKITVQSKKDPRTIVITYG